MAEIDPQNSFRVSKQAIEVISLDQADPGVDKRWIETSTYHADCAL